MCCYDYRRPAVVVSAVLPLLCLGGFIFGLLWATIHGRFTVAEALFAWALTAPSYLLMSQCVAFLRRFKGERIVLQENSVIWHTGQPVGQIILPNDELIKLTSRVCFNEDVEYRLVGKHNSIVFWRCIGNFKGLCQEIQKRVDDNANIVKQTIPPESTTFGSLGSTMHVSLVGFGFLAILSSLAILRHVQPGDFIVTGIQEATLVSGMLLSGGVTAFLARRKIEIFEDRLVRTDWQGRNRTAYFADSRLQGTVLTNSLGERIRLDAAYANRQVLIEQVIRALAI